MARIAFRRPPCWGISVFGEGTPPEGVTFTALSAGTYHVCGLRTDGGVTCWGWNEAGQTAVPPEFQ